MTLTVISGGLREQPDARSVIVIPARIGSSRFPGKPLVELRGATTAKPLIQRTWEVAAAAADRTRIWIATDDPAIEAAAHGFGAQTVMTSPHCRNGTERCHEALMSAGIDADIVVNLQGDAPLTPPLAIEALVATLRDDPSIAVATPMIACSPVQRARLLDDERRGLVGGTTVVADAAGNALYFSKRVIPHAPPHALDPAIHLHLGLYAYRRAALERYASTAPSPLEDVEGLEQLRFLHIGIAIRLVEIADPPGGMWEVNNPADIVAVERALCERRLD